tara:strand:- start:31 stop:303 length:273 start_codon:yes stop_codon:yes gene_type:complete
MSIVDKKLNDAWVSGGRKAHKLELIRLYRNQLLKETDEYAVQDRIMSDEMKTFRENLRKIPQTYTTEEQLDELMAKDENKQLTHSVWSKP